MTPFEVDIVIPHWGSTPRLTSLAFNCLASIRAHTRAYRVIWVDNGSPDESMKALRPSLDITPHLLIHNTENVGFIKATNQGLAVSSAPFIMLMNNDTEAIHGWIEKLRAPMDVCPEVGIVGPLTTTEESWQGKWPKDRTGYEILTKRHMLAFFCTMFRRGVFDRCGLLDEDFGMGLGDDDNYCWKAQEAGFKLALAQDLVIPHHHRSSFRTMFTAEQLADLQTHAMDLHHQKMGHAR